VVLISDVVTVVFADGLELVEPGDTVELIKSFPACLFLILE
jgi:hypothetical protein